MQNSNRRANHERATTGIRESNAERVFDGVHREDGGVKSEPPRGAECWKDDESGMLHLYLDDRHILQGYFGVTLRLSPQTATRLAKLLLERAK